MEIDMTYKLKVMQQNVEQEEAEHKATKARLADKNKIYESIEEAKSEAMKGRPMSFHTCNFINVVNSLLVLPHGLFQWSSQQYFRFQVLFYFV